MREGEKRTGGGNDWGGLEGRVADTNPGRRGMVRLGSDEVQALSE